MTSTLIVIGLITCLKVSDKTLFGEAIYREKISSQNYTFGIKQHLEWDLATIPSTKPFMHICTTPYDSLTSFEDMNFVKTRSSIFSSFHKDTHSVHFEIGYSKSSKWFESIKDKWNKYTNFYIGEFLEAKISNSQSLTSSPVKSSTSKYKDSFVLSTSNINNNSVITIDDHENNDPPEDSVNCSDNESTMQLPKCTRSKKQLSEN
ncbi:hypothetical protein RhiirA4_464275 [Rhizophagus irregularis]|uniref:Uncharacterized protein n=1 Tax=Rhizophagus irregularis TaxID=588596 RepID=A0A2I1GPT0_9GLOM|nr:hypothetical protein RhiirA4_464275 [Rhizophagus irregularis]